MDDSDEWDCLAARLEEQLPLLPLDEPLTLHAEPRRLVLFVRWRHVRVLEVAVRDGGELAPPLGEAERSALRRRGWRRTTPADGGCWWTWTAASTASTPRPGSLAATVALLAPAAGREGDLVRAVQARCALAAGAAAELVVVVRDVLALGVAELDVDMPPDLDDDDHDHFHADVHDDLDHGLDDDEPADG